MTDHAHDHSSDHLTRLLDLDATVLAGPLSTARSDLDRLADGDVRRILDVGAGTGAGTFALLEHFADAQVVAVDASEEMLAHLAERAARTGLSDRVTTVRADLDDALPDVGPVDVVWASASLHHLADPDRTLAGLGDLLRPGGLLAVLELAGFPRFVPDGTPEGDAEARAHALLADDRAVDLPTMGSDWGERLTRAGFDLQEQRTLDIDLASPVPAEAGEYAALSLSRVRGAVVDRLSSSERSAFDRLLDGGAGDVRNREDLVVRTTRWWWVARRSS